MRNCKHPATRLYGWFARDDSAPQGRVWCVACCNCGAVLTGEAEPLTEAPKKREKDRTVVVFRRWRDGDVIALFPERATDPVGHYCDSFQHLGGHSAADPVAIVAQTTPATPDEYRELAEELTMGYGYNLAPRLKITSQMFQRRKKMAKGE